MEIVDYVFYDVFWVTKSGQCLEGARWCCHQLPGGVSIESLTRSNGLQIVLVMHVAECVRCAMWRSCAIRRRDSVYVCVDVYVGVWAEHLVNRRTESQGDHENFGWSSHSGCGRCAHPADMTPQLRSYVESVERSNCTVHCKGVRKQRCSHNGKTLARQHPRYEAPEMQIVCVVRQTVLIRSSSVSLQK